MGAVRPLAEPSVSAGSPGKSDPPLTFHGLRHTFAAEKYKELTDKGMGALDAHFTVSRLLGHERADVTNVYLASLSAKDMKDKH